MPSPHQLTPKTAPDDDLPHMPRRPARAMLAAPNRFVWTESTMLKFLILLPLLVLGVAFGGALLLPLLLLAPVLLIAIFAIALPLLILRLVVGLVFGLGGLFFGLLG